MVSPDRGLEECSDHPDRSAENWSRSYLTNSPSDCMGEEEPGDLTACRTFLIFFLNLPFPGWNTHRVCDGNV